MLAPLLIVVALTPLQPQPAEVPWPTTSWPTGSPQTSDAAALEAALAVTESPRPGIGETRAVVVIQNGRLVAERYAPGFDAQTRLISWSIAKSITHALAGIVARDGGLKLDDRLPMRWAADDPRAAITWRQWLTMTDGLAYRELGASVTSSDAAKMNFGSGRSDVVGYMARRPLEHPPGTVWNYSTGGYNVIASAITDVVAPKAHAASERRSGMLAFMKERLFNVLGMTSAQPEFDAHGTFVGGSLLYATAHDFARFGLLYARDGMWDGKRVLPEGWVDFARAPGPAANIDTYGAGFWLAAPSGPGVPHKSLTQGPWKDTFIAEGRSGQLIVIVPSKDLVIVRLGLIPNDGTWAPLGLWLDGLIGAFPDHP